VVVLGSEALVSNARWIDSITILDKRRLWHSAPPATDGGESAE
jgi:hypothetical protein